MVKISLEDFYSGKRNNFNKALESTKGNDSVEQVLSAIPGIKKILETKDAVQKVAHHAEPDIYCTLFKDEVFKSEKIPSENFTNFLPEKYLIDSELENQILEICSNANCICRNHDNNPPDEVVYSGQHKEHILNVLKQYERQFKCENTELQSALMQGLIRKAVVKTPQGKGSIRVISHYKKNIRTGKTYVELLFIDFYHLFVPSRHSGFDSQKQLQRKYNSHASNSLSAHEFIKKEKIKWYKKL